MKKFKEKIAKLIEKETGVDFQIVFKEFAFPPNPEMGDLSLPCFSLAKKLNKSPIEISKQLKGKIENSDLIKNVESVGPYLNIFLKPELLSKEVLEEIYDKKSKYGLKKSNGKRIVIEFPAPNTNKPLHVGHVRNMCIGESISRLFESQGYKVFRVNLNNDRGIHICKSMLAYQKWGNNKEPDKKSDHFVGDFYVLFCKKAKENPDLYDEAQEMLRKWENGNKKIRELWEKMNKWALDGFKETYEKFGIKFDKEYYESEMYEKGKELILDGLKKGIFKKGSEGEVLIDLGNELGEKIVLRADGTSVYITQDLYLAYLKFKDFKYDKSIYVVASEQNYHFKVLFEILRKIGFGKADACYHLSYGMVHLPEGRLKSREGNVVDADELLNDVEKEAEIEIRKRKNIPANKLKETARKIALSAIKYFILKHQAQKDFIFRPKESISFEGNTGPYIQYSLVRANKILEKSKISVKNKIDFSLLKEKEEIEIIKKMSLFPEIMENSAKNYAPNLIAGYAYSLASLFNLFYEKYPVIQENKAVEEARLLLIYCFSLVLGSCLNLLGIEKVEQM